MRSRDVPLGIVLIVARIHEDNQPHFTARIVEEQRGRLRVRGFDPVLLETSHQRTARRAGHGRCFRIA